MNRIISLVMLLLLTGIVHATTWKPSEKTDPLTGEKVPAWEIMSYGSYIYKWPSKYDLVFWPLTDEGYIRGFRAVLDPAAVEVGMLVFVQVVLERTTPDVFDAFKSAVQARPEILECHMIAGGFDYLLKARVKDMRAYREFTASAVWALPGVRETHTYVVMEEVKETTELPLG